MLDYRFPTALQMVLSVAMAEEQGIRATSALLANGIEANPSLIRKLVVPLTRSDIFVTTLGRAGAIHLARPASVISMREIYQAVTDDKKLLNSRPDVKKPCCVVSENVCWYFKALAGQAEAASMAVLEKHSIADALKKIKQVAEKKRITSHSFD